MIKAQDDASTVQWVSLVGLRKDDLAFDHATAIWKSIQELFDDESNCISLFDIKEEQYQHTRMLLNTIKFNLGQTFLPIF